MLLNHINAEFLREEFFITGLLDKGKDFSVWGQQVFGFRHMISLALGTAMVETSLNLCHLNAS